jgi:DNA-binding MarR family transcriptional regulator
MLILYQGTDNHKRFLFMSSEGAAGDRVESRVGYQMKRAQHALRVEMDKALRKVGITTAQYAALSTLGAAPGLSGAELARRSFVTPQTMNAILANLEAAGLVMRHPHPEHGRVLQAYLTEMGEESVVRAHGIVEAVERRMLEGLSQDDRRWLLEALRNCADTLGGGAEGAAAGA